MGLALNKIKWLMCLITKQNQTSESCGGMGKYPNSFDLCRYLLLFTA